MTMKTVFLPNIPMINNNSECDKEVSGLSLKKGRLLMNTLSMRKQSIVRRPCAESTILLAKKLTMNAVTHSIYRKH